MKQPMRELAFAGWLGLLVTLSLGGLAWNLAHSAVISGTLTHATKYEGGADLGTNLKHSTVRVGTCSATGALQTIEGAVNVLPTVTTWSVTVPRAWGEFCANALSETLSGTLSVTTASVKTVVPEPKPQPPVVLVTSATTAYEWLSHPVEGTRLGRNVGTVPLGTPCAEEAVVQAFGGTYYAVPLDAVTLTKSPKSALVVALCEAAG